MRYDPLGELYDNKPKMLVHGSLVQCSSVRELARLAESKGFDVQVEPSGFMHDIRLNAGYDASAPMRHHSVRSAKRFLEQHPGCL